MTEAVDVELLLLAGLVPMALQIFVLTCLCIFDSGPDKAEAEGKPNET